MTGLCWWAHSSRTCHCNGPLTSWWTDTKGYSVRVWVSIPVVAHHKIKQFIKAVNNSFSFHLSQLRIRREMVFGLLTTKWQIFRTPIGVHLECLSDICGAAARLHNFVIDDEGRSHSRDLWSPTDFDVQPINSNTPGVLQCNKGCSNTLPTLALGGIVVDDTRRKFILGEIMSHQLERPIDNLIRNQELDEQSEAKDKTDGL